MTVVSQNSNQGELDHLFDQDDGYARVIIDIDQNGGCHVCIGPAATGVQTRYHAFLVVAAMDVLENHSLLTPEGYSHIHNTASRQMKELLMGRFSDGDVGFGSFLGMLLSALQDDDGEGSLFDEIMNDDYSNLFPDRE